MKNTDIANPDYFHKVVDCQWACPAHTPVPEYIRLIIGSGSPTGVIVPATASPAITVTFILVASSRTHSPRSASA